MTHDRLTLSPAYAMPWPVKTPFVMRPNLSRLNTQTPELFIRDHLAISYAQQKQAVLQTQREQALLGAADPRVLACIARHYYTQTGVRLAPTVEDLTLGMQEDFVILHDEPNTLNSDSATLRNRFLSVCFPSNWNPAEKLGLDFLDTHEPVADQQILQKGATNIVDMVFRKMPIQRFVWLLSPSSALALHPSLRQGHWHDALHQLESNPLHSGLSYPLLAQTYFRIERQTTLPLPTLKRGVFFIRLMVAPLLDVLKQDPTRPTELANTLTSMSEAVLAYRGMTAIRSRLIMELEALAANH